MKIRRPFLPFGPIQKGAKKAAYPEPQLTVPSPEVGV